MSGASDTTLQVALAMRARIEAATGYRTLGTLDLAGGTQALAGSASKQRQVIIVVPLADQPDRSRAARVGAVQHVTSRIGVLHILLARNLKDTGSLAMSELGETLKSTRDSLAGWHVSEVPGVQDAIQWRRGRIYDVVEGRIWWLDEYEATWWFVWDEQRAAGMPPRLAHAAC